ncbi:MAG: hypothetical protein CO189_03565 [candidate division Zixibacteria bacterium CG_4_9_14_3_um_filter_46_8]|nr:MAG: hypothetical protein CO189_03565 [candidate division Zixibacteria bacterium CG_4_9_14_3_um_filter_46_8]
MKNSNGPRLPSTDNLTLLLLPRFITFIFLFVSSLFIDKSQILISELLVLYGMVALAYLALLLFRMDAARTNLKRVLIFHIILEVIVSGFVVYHSGGSNSPLIMLFILSIASASMIYQMRGALLISLAASISYLSSIVFYIENITDGFSSDSFGELVNRYSDSFFSVSLNIVLFTIVGIITGYVAERLRDRGELLKTAEEELKKARLITADIIDGMGNGLICIDFSCEILIINRTAREILELDPAFRIEGLVLDNFEEGLNPLANFFKKAVSNDLSVDQTEVIVTTQSGRKVPLGINTSLLSGSDGKPRGIIAVFHDLTEAKILQQRLRAYDRMAAVGQLSAGIAHEIRNPLTSISGSVEVLKDELHLSGSNQKLMEVIINETQRLNRILGEFLLYARIKHTDFTTVRLKLLVNEVFELISNDKRIDSDMLLENNLSENDLALGDEVKISQVLLNLIFNSIEAIDHSGGRVAIGGTIDLGNAKYMVTGDFSRLVRPFTAFDSNKLILSGEYVPLSVSDNGRGIPDDRIEKIFQPFYSTRQGGTGLGLAIVQRLVESMDGVLVFETNEGFGTAFTVFLKKNIDLQFQDPISDVPSESVLKHFLIPS